MTVPAASARRVSRIRLVLGCGVALGLSACDSPRYPYPEAYVERAEEGCRDAPDVDGCMCVLEELQDRVPYEDIRAFENGDPPYQPYTKHSEASQEWEKMNMLIGQVDASCVSPEP